MRDFGWEMVDGTEPPTLRVRGDVEEQTLDEFKAALTTATRSFARSLRVDLSAVTFLPSLALGMLVAAIHRAAEAGAELELFATAGSIAEQVLRVTAMPHVTV